MNRFLNILLAAALSQASVPPTLGHVFASGAMLMDRLYTGAFVKAFAIALTLAGMVLLTTSANGASVRLEQTISPLGTASLISQSVALSDDVAIFGGDLVAEIHRFRDEQWIPEAILRPSPAAGYYASDVDICGNLAIVGDWNTRIAYVYRYDGVHWAEEARLTPNIGSARGFGASVAIEGNRAIVGAFGDGSGAAYIFEFSAGQWSGGRRLTPIGSRNDFGLSVDISGDTILVGGRGSAHFFEYDGRSWQVTEQVVGPRDDFFGVDVALDGDRAVIGAKFDSRVEGWEGAAYVYQHTPTGWMEQARLVADDATKRDFFGSAVSISGNYILVGTGRDDGQDPNPQPTAYLYTYSDGYWSQMAKIRTPGNGVAVTLAGARFMTGSRRPFGARTVQSYLIIPEPVTVVYVLSGALTVAAFRRKKKASEYKKHRADSAGSC